jgi:hypothetical protein
MNDTCTQFLKYKGSIVEMIYMNHAGVVSQRRVRVLDIHGHKLNTYCYTQQAPRVFHTERILAMVQCPVPSRK